MTSQEQARVQEAKAQIQQKYPWLQSGEIEEAYEIALVDYIRFLYPSANGRPTPETLEYDFMTVNRIKVRMLDILSRAGGINAVAYKENGIDIKYGSSYVDPNWVASLGLPKVGVPK
jgi:hypothetical protein